MSGKKQSFEDSLAELEKIVGKLEQGDLALEQSLELFEKGVRLSRECQERLGQAERRIEILLKDQNGNAVIESMDGQRVESVEVETSYKKIVFDSDDDIDDEDEGIDFADDEDEEDDTPF
jgi:exodeoxyribonuclease VII small subunit